MIFCWFCQYCVFIISQTNVIQNKHTENCCSSFPFFLFSLFFLLGARIDSVDKMRVVAYLIVSIIFFHRWTLNISENACVSSSSKKVIRPVYGEWIGTAAKLRLKLNGERLSEITQKSLRLTYFYVRTSVLTYHTNSWQFICVGTVFHRMFTHSVFFSNFIKQCGITMNKFGTLTDQYCTTIITEIDDWNCCK